jgi:hypothetical protein
MIDIAHFAGHVQGFPWGYCPKRGYVSEHRYHYFSSTAEAKKWFEKNKKWAVNISIYEGSDVIDTFTAPEDIVEEHKAGAYLIKSEAD